MLPATLRPLTRRCVYSPQHAFDIFPSRVLPRAPYCRRPVTSTVSPSPSKAVFSDTVLSKLEARYASAAKDKRRSTSPESRSNQLSATEKESILSFQGKSRSEISDYEVLQIYRVLQQCKQAKLWDSLVAIYNNYFSGDFDKGKIPSTCYNLRLMACIAQHDWKAVKEMRRALEIGEVKSTISTYNIILHSLVSNGEVSEALKLLQDLVTRGPKPDTVSGNTVLNGARQGAGSEALVTTVSQLMQSNNIPFDTRTYNIIIAVFCQLGDHGQVNQFLQTAVEKKLANTVTYNTIISNEVSRANWITAWTFVRAMHDNNIPRDEATYSPFLSAFSKGRHMHQLGKVLGLMEQEDVHVGIASINILLSAILFHGNMDDLRRLFALLYHSGACPDERTFNTILRYLRNRDASTFKGFGSRRFLQSFIDMQLARNPSLVSAESYNMVRQAMLSERQFRTPHERSVIRESNRADLATVHLQVLDLVDQAKSSEAAELLNEVMQNGVQPRCHTLVALLVGLLRDRNFSLAYKFKKLIHARYPKFDIRMQTSMIANSSPNSVIKDLQNIIMLAKVEKRELDLIFYTAAAWKLFRCGHFKPALNLLSGVRKLPGIIFDLPAWVVNMNILGKENDVSGILSCLEEIVQSSQPLDRGASRRFRRIVKRIEDEKSRDIGLKLLDSCARLSVDRDYQGPCLDDISKELNSVSS